LVARAAVVRRVSFLGKRGKGKKGLETLYLSAHLLLALPRSTARDDKFSVRLGFLSGCLRDISLCWRIFLCFFFSRACIPALRGGNWERAVSEL
jgi:hypothetical protein